MKTLQQIAWYQNRRDEKPNQELAKKLADSPDKNGIDEIAEGLHHKEKNVQSDCIKVLYEIGYLNPELISRYAGMFISLLNSKNNRLVWGGMIALMTISQINPEPILDSIDSVIDTIKKGTVITKDAGIRTIAGAISTDEDYMNQYSHFLLTELEQALPRDVPRYVESMAPVIKGGNEEAFRNIIDRRKPGLKASQLAKLKRVCKKIGLNA